MLSWLESHCMLSANGDAFNTKWMVALSTVMDIVTDRSDTERDQTAPEPASNAYAAHTGQPLKLGALMHNFRFAAMLTHRTINHFLLVTKFEVLERLVI